MANQDIKFKDKDDNYLFPLAHKDDEGNVIKTTYLNKTGTEGSAGGDLYLQYAIVETASDGTKTLIIIDQDGDATEFQASSIAKFG